MRQLLKSKLEKVEFFKFEVRRLVAAVTVENGETRHERRFKGEIELGRGWVICHKRIFRNESIFSRALRYNTSHKILICGREYVGDDRRCLRSL